MAQEMSNYYANLVLDQWFGKNATPTIPTTYYIALYTTTPGLGNSGGTEVSTTGTGYSRLAITNNTTNFSAAVSRNKQNATAFSPWFTASGSFGPVVAVGMLDASTAGNLIALNEIAGGSQQSVVSGNVISFNIGDLSITLN
jgi:hypothetical protein